MNSRSGPVPPAGRGDRSSRKFTWWTMALLAALCLVADLALGFLTRETVARGSGPSSGSRRPDAVYHHGFHPLYEGEERWQNYRYPMFTNSLGMRDREARKVKRTPSGPRIVFIGDSFTEGIGIRYEDTFVGRIEDALSGRGVEVLNAGVVSYSPKLSYLRVKHLVEVEKVSFDELHVFLDPSDIQDEVAYESFVTGRLATAHDFFLNRSRAWRKAVAEEGRSLADFSVTGRFVKYRLLGRPRPEDAVREYLASLEEEFWPYGDYLGERTAWVADESVWRLWGERGLDLCGRYLGMLKDLCRDNGIEMKLAIYPHPVMISRDHLGSKYAGHWRRFAAENGLELLDCFGHFIEGMDGREAVKKLFIGGDVHWNRDGHGVIAELWLDRFGGGPGR